jgi:DNA-binding transcriptional LysR family regulator
MIGDLAVAEDLSVTEVGKGPLPKTNPEASAPRLRIDWDDLRVFNAVAETGTMAGAARQLSVGTSMISKRIDDLEARLGATLFTRHPQGVALTEAGETVRDHARTMDRAALAIERVVGAQDKKPEGRVTIAAPDGIAAFWLGPRIAEFSRENPKIRIALDCGFWADDPLPEMPNLTISMKEEKRLDYVAIPLATLHYVLFAAPSYLDTYGSPPTLANIADHRFINFTPIKEQPQNWHPRAAALRTLANFSLETNSSAMMFHTLMAGGGIAVAPTAVKSFAPNLVMVYPEPMSRIQLYLVHHRDAMRSMRVRVAADWLKSVFDARSNPWFRDEFVSPNEF